MIPIEAGGIAPEGMDLNGILYDVTTHLTYLNAGGQYWFDAAFASKIGGYPLGAVLQSNDGKSSYVSIVDNNTTDFNIDPSSIGTSWLPWAGEGASSGSGILFGGTAGGTSEIITAAFEGLTELTDGLLVSFRATAANTSTNPSFNASDLGALTIVKGADLPLAAGDIGGGGYLVLLQYSATWNKWVLQNPATGINIVIPVNHAGWGNLRPIFRSNRPDHTFRRHVGKRVSFLRRPVFPCRRRSCCGVWEHAGRWGTEHCRAHR